MREEPDDLDDDEGDDAYTQTREQIAATLRTIAADETSNRWEAVAVHLGALLGKATQGLAVLSGERIGMPLAVANVNDEHVQELADCITGIIAIADELTNDPE
jgi:hypothetical protein